MGPVVPRFLAPIALAAALAAGGGCRDPIESGPGLAGREARALPLPSAATLRGVVTSTARAQAPAPRPRPPAGGPPAATRLALGAPPARPATVVGFPQPVDAILEALGQGEPTFIMPLGGSSSVLRMRFAGGLAAVYRPKTRGQPEGPLAEVAAYRVAAALGLDNVPPAALRRMPASELERRFSGDSDQWDELERVLAPETDGSILGAVIAYETDLRGLGLEEPRKRAQWEAWLAQGGELPEASRLLARDLSRMRVFDYLIGHRDRFHDPLRGVPDGSRILLRNHDTAFPVALAESVERRLRSELRKTERLSRSMIAGLAALDRSALEALVAGDGGPLLDARRIDGVLERRDTILSYVEALADRYGAAEVLAFE